MMSARINNGVELQPTSANKRFFCVYLIIKTSRFVNLVTYFLGQMLYNSFEKMFRLCGNSICIQIKGTLTQWYKVQDFLKNSVHPNFILKAKDQSFVYRSNTKDGCQKGGADQIFSSGKQCRTRSRASKQLQAYFKNGQKDLNYTSAPIAPLTQRS